MTEEEMIETRRLAKAFPAQYRVESFLFELIDALNATATAAREYVEYHKSSWSWIDEPIEKTNILKRQLIDALSQLEKLSVTKEK